MLVCPLEGLPIREGEYLRLRTPCRRSCQLTRQRSIFSERCWCMSVPAYDGHACWRWRPSKGRTVRNTLNIAQNCLLTVRSYSNMDYIFASSMKSYMPKRLVISYDIACQWSRHFVSRCASLPPQIRFDPALMTVEYVIPKFHIAAHGASCRSRYSLNFLRHMGQTDGENIERGWAWMNPASLSTREMGPGARADTLDDQWCSWNFRIMTRIGK